MSDQSHFISRRSFLGVAAAGAAVPLLAACSGGNTPSSVSSAKATTAGSTIASVEQKLYAAAKAEGQVVWYTGATLSAANNMKSVFEQQYPGITVSFVMGNVAQLLQKVSQEQAANQWQVDVLALSSPGQAQQLLSSEFIIPYKVFSYDSYPASSKGYKGVFELYDKFTPYGPIVFNTDKVQKSDVPTSIKDLFSSTPSKLRGKIIMNDVREWPYTVNYQYWLQTVGRDAIKQMDDLKPVFNVQSAAITDGITSGQYLMSPTFNMQSYAAALATKAPIDFVIPEEGIWMQPGAHYLTAGAPHPNAAKLWMEFIYSEAGQKLWTAPGYVPGSSSIPLPQSVAWTKGVKVVDLDFVKTFNAQAQLITEAKADFGTS